MKPKCLSCQFFTRWEQPSGGSIARCNLHPEAEEMLRNELRLWNVSGNWASTFEVDEIPSVLCGEVVVPDYICEEPGSDLEATIQDWLDSRLVMFESNRPVYRSVASIEDDVLWKFAACRDYVEMPEEELWDDPLFYSHYKTEGPAPELIETTQLSSLIDEIKRIFPAAVEIISVPVGCP